MKVINDISIDNDQNEWVFVPHEGIHQYINQQSDQLFIFFKTQSQYLLAYACMCVFKCVQNVLLNI